MKYLNLLKSEKPLPNELQKPQKALFCSFCSSASGPILKINGQTNCLGHQCEHSRYSNQKGSPFLWCGMVEKAVLDLMACPSGLWFKSSDNRWVFDTTKGKRRRFKEGCNEHHHPT